MYVAKHTMLYKHKVHDGQATVFYMDIRAAGKGYDEFVRRAIEETARAMCAAASRVSTAMEIRSRFSVLTRCLASPSR